MGQRSKTVVISLLLIFGIVANLHAEVDFIYTTEEGIELKFEIINESDKTCELISSRYSSGTLVIPKNANGYKVTSIGMSAFYGCSGLTSITIPNSVTYIGFVAFSRCSGLTSITLPNSVTHIGNSAFSDCSGITSITIPNSVTSIGVGAFSRCSGLTSIKVASDNKSYDSRDNCNAIIETRPKTLITGCKNTIIPDSVTSIGDYAFFGCSGLTNVTIPNSVTSIGQGAFSGCSGLTNVTIPNFVTSIGQGAFSGCSGLTSITIPNSVTSIESYAFSGCSGLTSITIPNSVTSIGYNAFEGCSCLTSITIPNSVTSIGRSAFNGCRDLTNITIPNSVTSIGSYAFAGTAWFNSQPDGLVYAGKVVYKYKGIMPASTNIAIADEALAIAGSAFYECSGLTSITIPNSVTSIGEYAFYECSGLTSITIPNSVTSIESYTFSGCSGLTSITISNSVTSIYYDAFKGCSSVKSIYSFIDEPMKCGGSWDDCQSATLYVPFGTSEKYMNAEGWNIISEIKEMADGLVFPYPTKENVMMNFTITDMNNLTCQVGDKQNWNASIAETTEDYVTIPHSAGPFMVNDVANNAFKGCSLLTGISFPETVKSINYQLLKDCKALASIEWNADTPIVSNLVVPNPNMLLYAKDKEYAPNDIQNVVVNGYAENIVLQDADDGNNFNCPLSFTVKTARYVHNYSMTSGYNTCQGWETIALPFDVTSITAQDGTELVPFAIWENGEGKKPFWLYEMTEEGWKEADGIKANKPYLISMPNNRYYPEEYNVKGDVTFVGNDVEVYASDNIIIPTYDNRKFIPNFLNNDASLSVYTLNVSNLWNNNPASEADGSTFIRNLRHVHPFEAYMTMEGAEAPDIIPVFEDGMPTSIQTVPLRNVHIHNANDSWYSLDGRKLQCKPTAKGVYIVNGSKVVIK